MKACVITASGESDVLELHDVECPTPGVSELLVRVVASGLNRADVLQRRGLYPAPPGVPPNIPGLEYAGVVEVCGPDVRAFAPGDRVMGLVAGGGCAEYLVTREELALPIPTDLGFLEAAAFPEAYITAYDAMWVQGGLRERGAIAMTAASSGVGTAAIQLATAWNVTVFGSTRSAHKLSLIHI